MAWTKAARDAAARKRRGHHLTKSARSKISSHMKGRHRSAATRARISHAQKGKHHRHKGHAQTAVTRKKLSLAAKRRTHKHHVVSQSTRHKLSAAQKGHKHPHKGVHEKHKHYIERKRHKNPRHKRLRRVPGATNIQVLSRLSKHRIRTTRRRISNQTLLQQKLHRLLMSPTRSRTNRKIIHDANKRRRRKRG